MVVTPSFQAKSPEFIAYAKANPGEVAMASAGTGSASHVIGELFKAMTGVDIIHVPYRNSYMPDLLGGQVHVAFSPLGQSIEYIRDGKLRALAVTGATRSVALPDVPAVSEFVQGYEAYVWDGIGAPKGTSAVIIDTLNKEINAILADPKTKARLLALGVEPMSMTPAEFAKFIADEMGEGSKVCGHQGAVSARRTFSLTRFANLCAPCPIRVKLRRTQCAHMFPLCPRRRTFTMEFGMSLKGQEETCPMRNCSCGNAEERSSRELDLPHPVVLCSGRLRGL
jgi:hypothetical protein